MDSVQAACEPLFLSQRPGFGLVICDIVIAHYYYIIQVTRIFSGKQDIPDFDDLTSAWNNLNRAMAHPIHQDTGDFLVAQVSDLLTIRNRSTENLEDSVFLPICWLHADSLPAHQNALD